MATEQTEQLKVGNDVENLDENEEIFSPSKDLEIKDDEEKVQVEDLASVETSVIEQEEMSESKNGAVIEEVKREEAEGEVIGKESQATALENSVNNSETSLLQVSEAETGGSENSAKDLALSEAVVEEAESKELPTSVIEEIETKQELPPALGPKNKLTESSISTVVEPLSKVTGASSADGNAEISQVEKIPAAVEATFDSLNEESTSNVETAASNDSNSVFAHNPEVDEIQDNATVIPETYDASEKAHVKSYADGATVVTEVLPEGEEASGHTEEIEVKNLNSGKPALLGISRDLVVDSISKESVSDLNETLKLKVAEATQAEDEAPKQEVPTKPSKRQSKNLVSKLKQSIVKVKKAFIGKSPSSKTMSTEGKDETKVE